MESKKKWEKPDLVVIESSRIEDVLREVCKADSANPPELSERLSAHSSDTVRIAACLCKLKADRPANKQ